MALSNEQGGICLRELRARVREIASQIDRQLARAHARPPAMCEREGTRSRTHTRTPILPDTRSHSLTCA
eukprot:6185457-Pleurochrysis_carterae.AAC.2